MMRGRTAGHTLRRAGMPATVAAVLLLAGCAGDGAQPGQPSGQPAHTGSPAAAGVLLNLTGTEYSFGPSRLEASAGPTTIRFTNKGAMDHDFVIDSLNLHILATPGKSAEATVTLKPGTYKTYCSVAGHRQSGMQGTLVVS